MGKKRIVTIGAEIPQEPKKKKVKKEKKTKEKESEKGLREATMKSSPSKEAGEKKMPAAKRMEAKSKIRPRIIKRGKRYRKLANLIDKKKKYSLEEAIELVKKTSFVKFDAAVEIHVHLGVDPQNSEQNVRGTVILPAGTGKARRILVFTTTKEKEAKAAEADYVGGEELINKVEKGFSDFDVVLATPEMMPKIARLGKILGKRGLMPNPKSGTIVEDPTRLIKEIKKGRIEFKMDAGGVIHQTVGRVSFPSASIKENIEALLEAINKAKPAGVKGDYIRSITLCATMGPGIKLEY